MPALLVRVVVLEKFDRGPVGRAATLNLQQAARSRLRLQFKPTLADIHKLETLARAASISGDLHFCAIGGEASVYLENLGQGVLRDKLIEPTPHIQGLPLLPGFGVPIVNRRFGAIGGGTVFCFYAFFGSDLGGETG